MTTVQLEISDDLAERLRPVNSQQIERALYIGLREINAVSQFRFVGAAEILELLASLPTPQEVLAIQPSRQLQERVSQLLEKNRTEGLSNEEQQEWQEFEYLEHLVRIAKAKAAMKLKSK